MGPSSTYTDEIGSRICEHMCEGKSVSYACRTEGISRQTFYYWQRQHDEFKDLVEQARLDAADTLADDLIEIADSEDDLNRAKLKIDARKWVAARMKPKSWGDRMQVDQTVKMDSVDDSELVAELKRKLAGSGIDVSELLNESA